MKIIKEKGELMVPIAIVVAAVIIALAVIFTNNKTGVSSPTANSNEQAAKVTSLAGLAKQIGIDEKAFNECQKSGKYNDKIKKQISDAGLAGGGGTPHSIIVAPNGNLIQVSGAQPLESLKPLFDGLVAGNNFENDTTIKFQPVTAEDHINGDINAPIKIVEYSDIDCPFCKRFHGTLEEVRAIYGDKVAWVYRHSPIAQLHPDAFNKSHATECVAEIGGNDKFWEYLKLLSN